MKKTTLAIIVTTIIALSALGPALYIPSAQAQDPEEWYTTVNGVLTSDSYELYPYNEWSVDMGLSKFGEMINYNPTTGSVGLQYPGYDAVMTYDQEEGTSRDPFANEGVQPQLWLNGWVLDIRYTHRTLRDRRVLTMAMFGDMADYGGDWINGFGWNPTTGETNYDLSMGPHGGRKTTGYAETEDLQVLYDGPREWIGMSVTHIYDWIDSDLDGMVEQDDALYHLVDLKLTFIFNKVKKQVIILKDVKQVITGKALDSPLDIQLSNREEWDMGPYPDWDSYAHFYHQEMETCYGMGENYDWHMADAILRENVEQGYNLQSVPVEKGCYGGPIASGSVRVYVGPDEVFMEKNDDYTIDLETGQIDWLTPLESGTWVKVVYKLRKYHCYYDEETEGWIREEPMTGVPHLYDVAQMISADETDNYVGWKAFWPTLSDYTVDGWEQSLDPLIWVEEPDMGFQGADEPEIPFVIGEWDFQIGKEYPAMFRGVEVVGITNWNDGADEQLQGYNELDREAKYQLDEVFNPWGLQDAVTKETAREVEFFDYSADFSGKTLTVSKAPILDPANYGKEWDSYCSFSERVLLIRGGTETLLSPRKGQYTINYATGEITINSALYAGDIIKVLYSTDWNRWPIPEDGAMVSGRYEWTVVGRDAASVDSAGASLVTAAIKNKGIEIGISGLDMMGTEYTGQIPYVLHKYGTDNNFNDYFMDPDMSMPGQRLSLRDDWCTNWATSSSNMITVGGPLANWASMYFNDFTDAFYATPWFTPTEAWSGKLAAKACWNKNAYANTGGETGMGYATIATYKDINGTVGLTIYGLDARDTYYATRWFHEEGAYQLQCAPEHLTSIILKINYADPEHPTYSVVETLGTISEAEWTHCWGDNLASALMNFVGCEDKGGIHDP
ncbi:MAG: hypothetical protein ACOC6G_02840 [Thermoproteota archaeon]